MGQVREPGSQQVLQILLLFNTRKSCSFTTFKEELKLAAPTLSRHLRTLQENGFLIRRGDREYEPGEALLMLAENLREASSAVALSQEIVDELAEVTGESAAFVQWTSRGFVFRSKREMPDSYHYLDIGQTNRGALRHAFGRLCLSMQPAAIIRSTLQNIPEVADCEAPLAELESIAAQGWLIGEDKGIRIAAAVFRNGICCGVLGISLMPQPLSEERRELLLEHVRSAAKKLTDLVTVK